MKAFPLLIEDSSLLKALTSGVDFEGKMPLNDIQHVSTIESSRGTITESRNDSTRGMLMLNKNGSLRFLAREMRLSLGLKQQEVAQLTCVSKDDVEAFESNFPVQLAARQKILRFLCRKLKQRKVSTKVVSSSILQ